MKVIATLLIFSAFHLSCGSSDSDSAAAAATGSSVQGVVKSSSGSQSDMASWVIVFVERDTGLSQFAVLGALGNYTIENVRASRAQTILLLDPQYRVSAVLTSPSTTDAEVKQYFTTAVTAMPPIVHQGPVLKFSDETNIFWDAAGSGDTDGDLIPNGLDTALRLVDTDSDGIDNTLDYDLDGDGLVNWFDTDNDGDDIADIFDSDANADETADLSQNIGDFYFSENIDFLAVQVIQEVQSDSSLSTQLLLTAKINSLLTPSSVSVLGATVLLGDAQANVANSEGAITQSAWDGTLADDALNEDGNSGDSLFARSISLDTAKSPKSDQVIFFQVVDQNSLTWNYPYTFSPVTSGVISGSYNTSTRVITKSGTPITSGDYYSWSVHVYDALGVKVYGSELVAGTVDTYTLPSDVLDATQTYTAKVVASSIDPVSSYPTWTVKSQSFNLQ